MLGQTRLNLLEELLRFDESINKSGLRIWCALEAVMKASGWQKIDLAFKEVHGPYILMQARNNDEVMDVWTAPVQLSVGPPRILAFVLNESAKNQQKNEEQEDQALDAFDTVYFSEDEWNNMKTTLITKKNSHFIQCKFFY